MVRDIRELTDSPQAYADELAVRTVMHDEGAADRITTVGSYLFRSA